MRLRCLLTGLLVLLPALAQADDGRVRLWLERMGQALVQLNYQGTFVYQHGGQLDSTRVLHAAASAERGEYEKLVALNGDGREIHRTDDTVTCYLPEQQTVLMDERGVESPLSAARDWDLAALGKLYRYRYAGEDRAAGRSCQLIDLLPRDAHRYGYRLCLDSANGMLLRSDTVDHQQQVVERMMFTDIRYPEQIPAAALAPELPTDGYVWMRHGGPRAEGGWQPELGDWQVGWLPAGFSLQSQRPHYGMGGRFVMQQLVYSDGLASISVFVEQLGAGTGALEGPESMGGVNAYARAVGAWQVTVVGAVPTATVARVARHIEHEVAAR